MQFANGAEYGERVDYFDELPSTQDFLKETYSLSRLKRIFHWVRANFQSAGRGRLGRSWQSQKGASLLCSVALNSDLFTGTTAQAMYLPLISLVSLCESLDKFLGPAADFFVKWPNDILFVREGKTRKLSGILVESKGGKFFVVGWGVNVRGNPGVETAISLEEIKNETIPESSVEEFFHTLRLRFYDNLQRWLAEPEVFEARLMANLRDRWMSQFWGREISVGGEKFVALSLDDRGSLRCRSIEKGNEESISCSHSVEMDLTTEA